MYKPKKAIWKGSNNPILRGQQPITMGPLTTEAFRPGSPSSKQGTFGDDDFQAS